MIETPPPPQQSRGMILDILNRIFEWLDKPWKAIALAGLAILVALGWGGWMSKDALVDVWKMSAGRPILKRSELPEILKHLRSETKADIVAYWSLNLSANAMNFELGVRNFGETWEFTPHRVPAIREPFGSARGLSELMAGQIVCRAVADVAAEANGDLFYRRMRTEKISRVCLIPVPPAPNILVGILVLCWVADPDNSTEEAALGLARETASVMVSRWE
jgi:hypothetical protein